MNPIVVSTRPRAHTPNGLSLYARWPLSRVLQRGKVQARSKRTGVERGQGIQRARPGRRGEAPAGLWTTESNILAVKRLV
jgi:hypothetical protein